jgi:hypothetical protein
LVRYIVLECQVHRKYIVRFKQIRQKSLLTKQILYDMVKFVSGSELYSLIQERSASAKNILWVCSPYLGESAHQIFSQNIIKTPPADVRFVFRVNDLSVKQGEVNPYEVQYLIEHFTEIRTNDGFHCKIYIFDDSAIISSANLTKTAFESNIEAGVLLENQEIEEVKDFFAKTLWDNSAALKNVEKYKRIWKIREATSKSHSSCRVKKHTHIKEWTDDSVATWYFNVPFYFSKKIEQKIRREANLPKDIIIFVDMHITSFRNLKLGDLVFIVDLNKKRGKVDIETGRVFDKCKVETDEGDHHFAYQTIKTYKIDRKKLVAALGELNLSKKSDTILTEPQIQELTNLITRKRGNKS